MPNRTNDESGVARREELDLAGRWATAVTGIDGRKKRTEWLDGWAGAGVPFSFSCGGKRSGDLLAGWGTGSAANGSENSAERFWNDPKTGLAVTWRIRRFTGFPAVEWVLVFENRGTGKTGIIEEVQALDLTLRHRVRDGKYTVRGVNGGRSLPDDMMPFAYELPSDISAVRNTIWLDSDGLSSNQYLPFFSVATPEHRGIVAGIGWSGTWLAQMNEKDGTLSIRAGLKGMRTYLQPGESFRTPRILVLFYQGKALHGQNLFRQLLHKHYVPKLNGKPQRPLVSVNVCFTHHGFGHFLADANEKSVSSLIQPFAKLGAELFLLDAGWYEGPNWWDWGGNWTFSRKKYPGGFSRISRRLNAAGMKFGIWFAPEMVTEHVPVFKKHPDWVNPQRMGVTRLLKMELPKAREWFLQAVDAIYRKGEVQCYRQDGGWGGWYTDKEADRKGMKEIAHIAGLYEIWDTIAKRYPGIIREGCCGGGRRIDLETLRRFHWHQKSDRWYQTESDQCSLYGANLFLPGGVINIPVMATDDYGLWSAFAGQLCLGWHPPDRDFPTAKAKKQVALYKKIRELLCGDFYPLTACSLDEAWIGYQFHRTDLDKGCAMVFKRKDTAVAGFPVSDTLTVRMRGVDPHGRYELCFRGAKKRAQAGGRQLMNGVAVTLRGAKGAELITYQSV